MSELLSLEEAQARLFALAHPHQPISVPSVEALGHYLAEDLVALRTQPQHALSAMDGWAVRKCDMPGPWRVIGESAAGHPFAGTVGEGEAARISTGAMLPAGSDMVVVQEQCERHGDKLSFSGEPPSPLDRHVRTEGLDFHAQSTVLERGQEVTARSLALALSAGHAALPVHPAPNVTIIDSGDELVPAGSPLSEGQIPASNGPMLAAMLRALPCSVTMNGPVPDRLDQIVAALETARDADLVITTGGASVGDHDLIRPALDAIGANVGFWRVAIKPGKPIMVATRGKQVLLGLPGNPVSAFVTATLFALPIVRALLGAAAPTPRYEHAICAAPLPATGKRAEFLRARFGPDGIEPVKVQDSGALRPLAAADVLICRDVMAPALNAGEMVRIIRL